MQTDSERLLERIRLGEDTALELKELVVAGNRVEAPARASLADELAAMANAHGGACVLGVRDKPRQVVGIELGHLDEAEAWLRNICADLIEPQLAPAIYRVTLPTPSGAQAAVLRVEVPRSMFVHRSPGGYFHRVGSSKRQMSPDYLARLFQQRSQSRLLRFDEDLVPNATLADLSEPLWQRFRTPRSQSEPMESLLGKLAMARQDESGVWRPTLAGVLMATTDPLRFMRNSYIQAVAYAGTTTVPERPRVAYQLDAADISGPLDQQVTDALRFVARNMKTSATKEFGRRDLPQYDLVAVFEALVNAVAHRDYSVYGSKIRLRVHSDRIELYSPGGLANSMGVDGLALRQAARNEALTSLLAKCPVPVLAVEAGSDRATMMDRRGEGVNLILDRSQALSGRLPEFHLLDEAELMLTIWAAGPTGDQGGLGGADVRGAGEE